VALTIIGPIVIVIDALDESGDTFSQKALLEVLAKRAGKLPSNFRILITARPETDIIKAFSGSRYTIFKPTDTLNNSSNEGDITLFIQTRLADVPSLELEWPNQKWCRMLLEGANGLFQWASTACRAITDGQGGLRPTELLIRFCSLGRGLDELYSEVLSQTFDASDPMIMSRFNYVMGRILATKEPLSVAAHEQMFEDGDADLVGLIVKSMGSLLSGGLSSRHTCLHSSYFIL